MSSLLRDEFEDLTLRQLLPPIWERAGLGFLTMALQFKQAQHHVSERGHDVSGRPATDFGSVFAQADIPSVMRAVFATRPVPSGDFQQFLAAVLLGGCAGVVEGVFFGLFDHFAFAQVLLFPPDRQELPATAQPCFLRTDADPLDAPAAEPSVFFGPTRIVLSGKKKLWAAWLRLVPECRFDCL